MGPGRLAGEYVDAHTRKVGEVMTRDVIVVGASTDLAEIEQLMEKRRIKRVPVVANGKLVDIVGRSNPVRALVHKLTRQAVSQARDAVSDGSIQRRISRQAAQFSVPCRCCASPSGSPFHRT